MTTTMASVYVPVSFGIADATGYPAVGSHALPRVLSLRMDTTLGNLHAIIASDSRIDGGKPIRLWCRSSSSSSSSSSKSTPAQHLRYPTPQPALRGWLPCYLLPSTLTLGELLMYPDWDPRAPPTTATTSIQVLAEIPVNAAVTGGGAFSLHHQTIWPRDRLRLLEHYLSVTLASVSSLNRHHRHNDKGYDDSDEANDSADDDKDSGYNDSDYDDYDHDNDANLSAVESALSASSVSSRDRNGDGTSAPQHAQSRMKTHHTTGIVRPSSSSTSRAGPVISYASSSSSTSRAAPIISYEPSSDQLHALQELRQRLEEEDRKRAAQEQADLAQKQKEIQEFFAAETLRRSSSSTIRPSATAGPDSSASSNSGVHHNENHINKAADVDVADDNANDDFDYLDDTDYNDDDYDDDDDDDDIDNDDGDSISDDDDGDSDE